MAAAALFAVSAAAPGCRRRPRRRPPSVPRYAVLKTSMGEITARLFLERSPATVRHFVGLATGEKPWRDPRTGEIRRSPLYERVPFFRVIPGLMVQTGDPAGDGTGEIGVLLADELDAELRFDRPGLLGLANSGPDSNSGQFFITTDPAPELDGRHPIFGEVVSGLEVVRAISRVPRDMSGEADRPIEPAWLESVTITERGP